MSISIGTLIWDDHAAAALPVGALCADIDGDPVLHVLDVAEPWRRVVGEIDWAGEWLAWEQSPGCYPWRVVALDVARDITEEEAVAMVCAAETERLRADGRDAVEGPQAPRGAVLFAPDSGDHTFVRFPNGRGWECLPKARSAPDAVDTDTWEWDLVRPLLVLARATCRLRSASRSLACRPATPARGRSAAQRSLRQRAGRSCRSVSCRRARSVNTSTPSASWCERPAARAGTSTHCTASEKPF